MTTCACGHDAAHHQTVWHRAIPCIVTGCGCMKFLSAPSASVGDADALRRAPHPTDCDVLQRGHYEMNGFPPTLRIA